MESKSFPVKFGNEEYVGHYVTDLETAINCLNFLQAKDILFGIDIETEALPQYKSNPDAALSPHLSVPRLIQIFDGKNVVVFDCKLIGTFDIFIPFLSTKRLVAHNAMFELQAFLMMGVKECNIGCTMVLVKLLYHAVYPTDNGLMASLDAVVKTLFNIDLLKQSQVSDWSIPDLNFEQIEYAALDAVAVLRAAESLAPGLEKFKLERTYSIIKAAQYPIARMQLNGIGFNVEKHREFIPIWRGQLYEAKKEVLKITGLDALSSHKLADWLVNNLPEEIASVWPRTDKGDRLSTDSNTFVDFNFLPVVKPFSDYQEKSKLCSTYGNQLIEQVNAATKRLHARFNLCGARTGRLSCSKPNLQNLPRSPEEGSEEKDIRDSFITYDGWSFVCADYSQIEIRVAAEVSGDYNMLKAYRDGIDIHKLTACNITGKSIEQITKQERQMGKALGLGLLFGLGAEKFVHYIRKGYPGLSTTLEDSKKAIKSYRELYSGFRQWQIDQSNSCGTTLQAVTPCGKQRKLPADSYYGSGLNHPIQGGAAEVILYALIFLTEALERNGLQARIVNCVHDEILVECPDEEIEEVKWHMDYTMKLAYKTVFPKGITNKLVEIGTGKTWSEAK